jgi:hypothetical protein
MIFSGWNPGITNGLVMHFPFNNSSIDIISGTNYFSGSVYKTTSPLPIFSASYLDATTPIYNSATSLPQLNTTTLSYSGWIAFPSATFGAPGFFMVLFNISDNIGVFLCNINLAGGPSDKVVFGFQNGGVNSGEGRLEILSSVIANQWYHIVFTINNKTINIYLNGIQLNTVNSSYTPSTITLPYDIVGTNTPIGRVYNHISFGCSLNGGSQKACYHDDVRLYNRILTQSDVTAIYNYRG